LRDFGFGSATFLFSGGMFNREIGGAKFAWDVEVIRCTHVSHEKNPGGLG